LLGGPLSEKKGDFLTTAGIPLAQLYGATDCGPVSILPPRDLVINGNPYWQWVEFSDTGAGNENDKMHERYCCSSTIPYTYEVVWLHA
jgi:hypothetical protein